MPDSILRIICKNLLPVVAVCALAACSDRPEEPRQTPASRTKGVTAVEPIDAQGLGVQNLISFDVYSDGSKIHALFAAAVNDKPPYIGYLRSDDGGRHWTAPVEIGHHIHSALESKIGNDLQIAAFGDTLLAIWQVSGEIPGMGPLVTLSSVDGGQNWTQGVNPTASETDQSHADLAADAQGRFHLVWLDDRDENGYQGVRYARSIDAGRHWEQAQTIDDSSCSCCWNRMTVTPDGQLNVLYRDMEPRDMALAQSNDGGLSWQRTSTVGEFNWIFDGCPHNGGGLAISGDRSLHSLVWTGAENKAGLYHLYSADGGKIWSAPQAMGVEPPAFHSDIAVIDAEHVAAIWDALGPEGSTVMISESADNGGNWSSPRLLSAAGSSASFPRLIATQSGWLAMWMEQKSGAAKQWMSAILQ